MSNIQAIAFDLDGLMVNTESLYWITSRVLLERRGVRGRDDVFFKMMGHTNARALQIMIDECALEATVEQLLVETNELFVELLDTKLQTSPGLYELIEQLNQRQLRRVIVTNSRHQYAVDMLERIKLSAEFVGIVASDDVAAGKPDPEGYRKGAHMLGVDPTNMLVLEDSTHGCAAGLAAGATVVVVPNEHNRDATFEGAHLCVSDLSDPRILALVDDEIRG